MQILSDYKFGNQKFINFNFSNIDTDNLSFGIMALIYFVKENAILKVRIEEAVIFRNPKIQNNNISYLVKQ